MSEKLLVSIIIPVYNTEVSVKASDVSKVYLAPQGTELNFAVGGGYISFTVDKIENHQLVIIEQGEQP